VTTSYVPVSRTPGPSLGALLVAVSVGVGSFLLGLVPFVVEPAGSADPVSCGPTWFRGSGLPAECYAEVDVWAVAAKTGLAVATILLIVSAVAAVRTHRSRP
jgi:hypothetical protein